MLTLAPTLFKAYDIRGIVDQTLTPEAVRAIGQVLGSMALEAGQSAIAVGRDGRLSGPTLSQALREGIAASGCDAIDIGCVPTPTSYFAAFETGANCAVSVTGSHNPTDYNGLKMVIAGTTLWGEAIQAIRTRALVGEVRHGVGRLLTQDVRPAYLARILGDITLARPLKIAVDCGNGVAGELAPQLLKALGCEVHELYCEIDGTFPNHHPDPSQPKNLVDVIAYVKEHQCDLGLAFDGDGDRLGVVTRNGENIFPDRQMMLYAADILSRNPGAEIIYDVKCSRKLASHIREHGGKPTMWKTGHSLVKAKLKETGAPLGGEMSGHIFFKERWYGFDDALYCAARLLEIVSKVADPSALLENLPNSLCTPELNIACSEGEHHAVIGKMAAAAVFDGATEIITIDGLRVEYADGFGLARGSNTTPVIVLRFEADTEAALNRIQQQFETQLRRFKTDFVWPTSQAAH
jgi:phosphomannomutase / phosphoglucomutase